MSFHKSFCFYYCPRHEADDFFSRRFEVQLAAVKERLEAAKAGSTRGLNSPTIGGFSFSNAGSRIAKPLRGGGGDGPAIPVISNIQQNEGGKRGSWFFQKS
jgi:kinesin family protein 5